MIYLLKKINMSTLLVKDYKQNILSLENSDVDLNELFTLSYNFDILKTVLTSIVKQNKASNNQFTELQQKIDSKDKLIGNLELKLVNSVRMITEKLEEKAKDLDETMKVNFENQEKDQKAVVSKLEQLLLNLQKRIERLEGEDKQSKEKIDSLENQLLELRKQDLKPLKDNVRELTNSVADLQEKDNIYAGKFLKIERQVNDLVSKYSEINVFEVLKGGSTSNRSSKDQDTLLLVIEGIKNSMAQKTEQLDGKIDIIQEAVNKLKTEMISSNRKHENSREKENELSNRIEGILGKINEIRSALNQLFQEGSFKSNKFLLKIDPIPSAKNINSNTSDSDLQLLTERLGALESKLAAIEDELKSQLNIEHKESNKLNNNNTPNINTSFSQNTNINSALPEDANLRTRVLEIEKQIKVINIKERERDDNFNKKLQVINDTLKKKIDKDTFYNFSEEVDILKKKHEEFREEYRITVEKNIMDDLTWIKKKIESITLTVNDMKANSRGGTKEKDIDFYLSDVVGSGKYLEISVFNEFKTGVNKDIAGLTKRLEEIQKFLDELQFIVNTKANEKDLKLLEGK